VEGRIWLWPLVVPALLSVSDRPRWQVAAGAMGLAWLVLEASLIGHRGWTLAALSGFGQPDQAPLGWGALAYALACGAFLARGLARLGFGGGQMFVTRSLLLIGASLLVFVFWPILRVLTSAVQDDSGVFAPALFFAKLTNPSILSLGCLSGGHCGVAWNTVALAIVVAR